MFISKKEKHSTCRLICETVFLVSLTSILFVYPFDSHFRFTVGVIMLALSLLYFLQLPIILTAVFCGIGVFSMRWLMDVFVGHNEMAFATIQSLPAFCYYVFFGICCYYFNIRENNGHAITVILKLLLSDFLSNLLEISIRHDFMPFDSAAILPALVGVAFLRSVSVVYGYYFLNRYRVFIFVDEHLKRYTQLIMLFAKLKTELYYLKKSSQDIEKIMECSYLLYKELSASTDGNRQANQSVQKALKIAGDIHEIKKDYYRVIHGLEKILLPAGNEQNMRLSEIFHIIEQNTKRSLSAEHKEINIQFDQEDDFATDEHYQIVSMLNNLIVNAIEACGQQGAIQVREVRREGTIALSVEDNGQGIDMQNMDFIFNPGFSTKYSKLTGTMSTGLGLAHVRTLLDSLGGRIEVTSQPGIATIFTLVLPYARLQQKTNNQRE